MRWADQFLARFERDKERRQCSTYLFGQLMPGEEAVCMATHWHGEAHRIAQDLLTSERIFAKWAFDDNSGFAQAVPWISLQQIDGLTSAGPVTLLAVRREGPPALSRGQLPFFAAALHWRSRKSEQFFEELVLITGRPRTILGPGGHVPESAPGTELELLRGLLPTGTSARDQLESGAAAVVAWAKKHGRSQ